MASLLKRFLGIPDKNFIELAVKQEIERYRTSKPATEEKPQHDFATGLPNGRQSIPEPQQKGWYDSIAYPENYRIVQPDFLMEVIPIIRKLCYVNPDMGQALHNIVSLGNTGHKIFFDRRVSDEQVDAMRNHITNKHKDWAPGQAGANGLVNRLMSQLMIGGASSVEWVPENDLSGVKSAILVNPEEIRFKLKKDGVTYAPYQRVRNSAAMGNKNMLVDGQLVELNTNTYQYYALNGDTEIPYGIPPYMTGLGAIKTQNCMNGNIEFVVEQMGLLGFLQVLIAKPPDNSGRGIKNYEASLNSLLSEAKARVQQGFKDGTIVGFKDDHQFDFTSISRDYEKAIELYKNNELQLATGLKQDASLWGRNYNTSETNITIVFMKMLSELRNIQNIVKTQLVFGYTMELRLAGFDFDFLTVEFNPSTIQDDLKLQQAREIRIRNLVQLYIMGTISENQFADEMGYEAPDQPQPRVPVEMLAGAKSSSDQAASDQKREKKKDESDKKVRDKNKPIPKN